MSKRIVESLKSKLAVEEGFVINRGARLRIAGGMRIVARRRDLR